MKSTTLADPNSVAEREDDAIEMNHNPEACPVCGKTDAREFLRGPDRFHGRKDQYTLVRCPACSLVWLSHPPEPSEMHLHYTAAYDRLISASGGNFAALAGGVRKKAIGTIQAVRSAARPGLQFGIVSGVVEGRRRGSCTASRCPPSARKSRRQRPARRCSSDIFWTQRFPANRSTPLPALTCWNISMSHGE